MCAGIDHRIRRLGRCDRLLLLLTGCWAILAIPGNYLRVHGLMDGGRQLWTMLAIQILWMLLLAAIAGVIAYSVMRQQRRPADYGFSFKRGGLASLAILAVVHVYLVIGGKFVLSATGSFFALIAWGAFMEELVFAIAITAALIGYVVFEFLRANYSSRCHLQIATPRGLCARQPSLEPSLEVALTQRIALT